MPCPLSPHLAILLALAVPVPATSAQSPAPGHRVYSSPALRQTRVVDTAGNVVHVWQTTSSALTGIALTGRGELVTRLSNTFSNVIQQFAYDGTVVWQYEHNPAEVIGGDLAVLPNGNVLLIANAALTSAQAIAAGRNPPTVASTFKYSKIVEVQPTGPTSGTVVWEWRAIDHAVQDFDPTQANYGVVSAQPGRIDINYPQQLVSSEWNHVNGIDLDPVEDWLLISSPVQNEVWIVDHGTTTAEAAGSTGGRRGVGGDLLYRWGNPLVYRAGTASEQKLFWQHDPRFVPPGYLGAGNVTVFNNQYQPNQSQVVELALPVDASGNFVLTPGAGYGPEAPAWTFTQPGMYASIMSGVQRLPNGNTLICVANQSRLLEVTPQRTVVWQHTGPLGGIFHAHYTDRSLWADRESLTAAAGGPVAFGLEAGSVHAGRTYLMLGSASGTSPGFAFGGITVPLNPDGYLYGIAASLGTGPFASWAGTLDASGGGSARYDLPPIPPVAGITLHHAMLVIDVPATALVHASNAVPLSFQ